jgi:hypothetical protein
MGHWWGDIERGNGSYTEINRPVKYPVWTADIPSRVDTVIL